MRTIGLTAPIAEMLGTDNTEQENKTPFIPNRRQKRQKKGREFSNKKGIQMVVHGKFKYKKVFQRIGKKTIVHSILVHPVQSN